MHLADLAGSNVDSLVRHQNWSVCSCKVDTVLTQLRRSWNVYIPRNWCTSWHSKQLQELLVFRRTGLHSLSVHPTHIELLHQKNVSSVSLIETELHFPPITSTAMKLAPKRVLAPFTYLFFLTDNVNSTIILLQTFYFILQNLCVITQADWSSKCTGKHSECGMLAFDSIVTADYSFKCLKCWRNNW